ncbi:MAG: hypothetical protein WCA20_25185 [Candidatus Sulfotelmatobacter sp.]
MGPATRMKDLRPSDLIVSRIAVRLQKTFELSQKLFRSIPILPKRKSNTFSRDAAISRTALPRLPAPRIAPAVEAGYHHNPIVLHLEEYAMRETPHSRTSTAPVCYRELQRMFCECLNRGLDRQRETIPQPRADVVIPSPRFQ